MKYWTICIGEKVIRINLVHIFVAISIFVCTFLSSTFTVFQFVHSSIHKANFFKQKKKNEQLTDSIQKMVNNINILNIKLDSLVNIDNKNRLVWGLDTLDEDIEKLGVGGSKIQWSSIGVIDKLTESLQALKNRTDFVSQSFDELTHSINRTEKVLNATPSVWPAQGSITSNFGWRRMGGSSEFHSGMDIANNVGTPVLATAAGVITRVEDAGRLGLCVEIDHGFGYRTLYGHLSRTKVSLSKKVNRNEVIGYMGSTGRSTGPHLHYEVRVSGESSPPLNYIIPGATTY
ncbi:MAG: M23 family metallopeptidase [bacterium]|nr:M23 family metallopeptidase [bacterium]